MKTNLFHRLIIKALALQMLAVFCARVYPPAAIMPGQLSIQVWSVIGGMLNVRTSIEMRKRAQEKRAKACSAAAESKRAPFGNPATNGEQSKNKKKPHHPGSSVHCERPVVKAAVPTARSSPASPLEKPKAPANEYRMSCAPAAPDRAALGLPPEPRTLLPPKPASRPYNPEAARSAESRRRRTAATRRPLALFAWLLDETLANLGLPAPCAAAVVRQKQDTRVKAPASAAERLKDRVCAAVLTRQVSKSVPDPLVPPLAPPSTWRKMSPKTWHMRTLDSAHRDEPASKVRRTAESTPPRAALPREPTPTFLSLLRKKRLRLVTRHEARRLRAADTASGDEHKEPRARVPRRPWPWQQTRASSSSSSSSSATAAPAATPAPSPTSAEPRPAEATSSVAATQPPQRTEEEERSHSGKRSRTDDDSARSEPPSTRRRT
eukprot:m51a1_g3436 hypothetical protein (436) ;mRNA; f:637667-639285